jgi:formylglycine-generating enzyme required for sulfatase activity
MTNCGRDSESCCTSLEVRGGTYYRSYDTLLPDGGVELAADGGPIAETDPAAVSDLQLDKYEVTVGRFRQFVAAWNGGAGYAPPAWSGKHVYLNGGNGLINGGATNGDGGAEYETGWDVSDNFIIAPTNTNLACDGAYETWTNTATTQENLPINCVNWYEAYAFCIWDGGFLPSEAEWEYAAGGSQQREYPWGPMAPGTNNQYAIFGCYYPSGSPEASANFTCAGAANIAPVGSAASGAGAWGQLDLAGNVWEWNLDYWDGTSAYVNPCTECADLNAISNRVIRGGDFNYDEWGLLVPHRDFESPTARRDGTGFRCARSP